MGGNRPDPVTLRLHLGDYQRSKTLFEQLSVDEQRQVRFDYVLGQLDFQKQVDLTPYYPYLFQQEARLVFDNTKESTPNTPHD